MTEGEKITVKNGVLNVPNNQLFHLSKVTELVQIFGLQLLAF